MKRFLVIAALLAAAAPPATAFAQDRPAEACGRQVPLSRVLATISGHTPGRHLNTTMGDQGGRPAYFVKWQMPDGRVVVIIVDACTGQELGRQG
jgi:hypothetical protein